MTKNTFYVTTPIYYVTAKPHLGSLYSTLLADVIARWHKLQGNETFLLTGTDEHGQKVARAAVAVGKEPKAFVDSFIPAYLDAWQKYEIAYTKFIRTTDPSHIKGVQHLIKKLLASGDIYKDTYMGWYCTPCETFVTSKDTGTVTEAPLCPSCGRETEMVSEETYFFRLSAYQDKLLQFYKNNPNFIVPKERLNEVISFVESGLKDLSISRTTVTWGIPFPDDAAHRVYVWLDALTNYITGVGYGDPRQAAEFAKWWPADLQILGKDIVRFHAVYWLSFLMAAQLPLPRRMLVHGWIQVNKQKMSKSLGNVVDPMVLQEAYGVDEVRYYLMRYIPVNQDGEFSTGDLERAIETDLANDLGNLLNRMVGLAEKYGVMKITPSNVWEQAALDLRDECWNMIEDVTEYMQEYMIHLALARVWKYINLVNAYFHGQEPWKLAKKDPALFMQVLSATAHSLYVVGQLLWPIMPHKMEALLASLGLTFAVHDDSVDALERNPWHQTFMLKKIPTLFAKPMEDANMTDEHKNVSTQPEVQVDNYISIDDVVKVELLVGTIEECESVENSDKLLKFQVNFGAKGMRQILAGIKKYYMPEDLIGKQGVFIFNLKPRKMLGTESQGMMLVVHDADGMPRMVAPRVAVPNGQRLQ